MIYCCLEVPERNQNNKTGRVNPALHIMLSRNRVFHLLSIAALMIAVYHTAAVIYRLDTSPVLRHVAFATICVACSYGFHRRHPYFIFCFVILVIQQYYSHGTYLVLEWARHHAIDWPSIILLITYPFILLLLWKDWRATRSY